VEKFIQLAQQWPPGKLAWQARPSSPKLAQARPSSTKLASRPDSKHAAWLPSSARNSSGANPSGLTRKGRSNQGSKAAKGAPFRLMQQFKLKLTSFCQAQ